MNKQLIKVLKKDFYTLSSILKITNISLDDDYIIFKADKKAIDILNINNINYEVIQKSLYSKIVHKYIGLLIGVLLFFVMMYFNSFRVTNIKFNNNYIINSDIEEIINDSSKKVLGFNIVNNLDDIEKHVRRKYYTYPWITMKKKGTTIMVDIADYDSDYKVLDNNEVGNVVAKNDAIIKSCYVYQGSLCVKNNQYVKKGDKLIDCKSIYEARGLVIGSFFEEYNIEIPKIEYIDISSNIKESVYSVNLFNKRLNLKRKYKLDNYKESSKELFSLFGISIYKNVREGINNKKIEYNLIEAKNKALEEYEKYFKSSITSSLEEINDVSILNIEEFDNSYKIKILAKVSKSIGEFVPF